MKSIYFRIYILVILFSVSNCFSQSADDVLSKYFEATGGKTNWESIKSIKYTGYSNIMGMDIPFTQYVKRPGMWLIEIQVQGMKISQGFDGTVAWFINPMTGSKKPQKADDETAKTFKYNSLIGGKLYNINEMGFSVELIGKEEADGKEYFRIKLTDKDGAVSDFFIDANSYLITKVISKTNKMGNEIKTENNYNNYKKINDVLISYFMEQKIEGGQIDSQTITLDKVEINTEIDDKIFSMPNE